jgi:hypothetical protein
MAIPLDGLARPCAALPHTTEMILITMAKHGDPASENGRPPNRPYDHSKTKDIEDAGGGRHSGEDKGSKDRGEDEGGEDKG